MGQKADDSTILSRYYYQVIWNSKAIGYEHLAGKSEMAQNGDKWQKVTVMMWGCGGGGEGQGKDDFRTEVAEWPGEVRNGTRRWQMAESHRGGVWGVGEGGRGRAKTTVGQKWQDGRGWPGVAERWQRRGKSLSGVWEWGLEEGREQRRPKDNPVPDQPPRPLSYSAAKDDDGDEGCEGDGNLGPGGLHAHQVPMKNV